MQFFKCATAVSLAAPIFGSGGNPVTPVTVHEWGTFTTVSDEAGQEAEWSPLGAPSDLPCFVQHLHGLQFKSFNPPNTVPVTRTVTVRMETPVLYFYAPKKTTLSVAVDFPKGLITEWYPKADKVTPEPAATMPEVEKGRIEWNNLDITPGEKPWLAKGTGPSPYYAARDTDSDPVRVGNDQEKLLFYRGIANFQVPVTARTWLGDSIDIGNTGAESIKLAILFENRSGKIGYRIMRGLAGHAVLDAPELTANLATLKHDLAGALVEQGLYPKEAAAMVATWSDSWFEEGMRVFYLVPRSLVDRELPLTIKPAAADIRRVFVGRVEVLSPYRRDKLATALVKGDTAELDRLGRFLLPFLPQVAAKPSDLVAPYLAAKATEARKEFFSPSCVR